MLYAGSLDLTRSGWGHASEHYFWVVTTVFQFLFTSWIAFPRQHHFWTLQWPRSRSKIQYCDSDRGTFQLWAVDWILEGFSQVVAESSQCSGDAWFWFPKVILIQVWVLETGLGRSGLEWWRIEIQYQALSWAGFDFLLLGKTIYWAVPWTKATVLISSLVVM